MAVKIVVKTIWLIELKKRKLSLRVGLIWEIFFEEIEFEMIQKQEVEKTEMCIPSRVTYESNIICWVCNFHKEEE